MRASQALALERLLQGEEFAKKPGTLLKSVGAKLVRASDLPAQRHAFGATASDRLLESLIEQLPAKTLI